MDGQKFIRKSKSRGDKIARVNSICITKSINYFIFILYGVGVRCDVDIFTLTARAYR